MDWATRKRLQRALGIDDLPTTPQPVFAPVSFRTAHGEPATSVAVTGWDAVDFEVYENLVAAGPVPAPIVRTPGQLRADARIAQHEARNLIDSMWDLPKAERPAVKAAARALYVKASKLAAAADDAEDAESRALSAADLHLTTEIAYLELDRQRAEQVAFERSAYELAAGGDR
jgi:hypothetical protein